MYFVDTNCHSRSVTSPVTLVLVPIASDGHDLSFQLNAPQMRDWTKEGVHPDMHVGNSGKARRHLEMKLPLVEARNLAAEIALHYLNKALKV